MAVSIYLAGPDVFLPNARDIGARKQALCAELGFVGLFPLDSNVAASGAAAIFQANCALMRQADLGMLNLTPFRGPSADAGTAFEAGFLASLGKPLYGYSSNPALYRDRVEALFGLTSRDARLWDGDGLAVEDFGLLDNLMLHCAIESGGGAVVAVPGERGEADLPAWTAFRRCLERVAATLASVRREGLR